MSQQEIDRLLELAETSGDPDVLRGLWWSAEGEARALVMLQSAKLLLQAGRVAEAWYPIAEAAKATSTPKHLRQADRLLRQAAKIEPPPAKRRCRVAILTSYTADTLIPLLRAQCFGMGIDATFHTGPFNQIVQQIQDPASSLAAFQPEVVVIAPDWRWLGLPEESTDPAAALATRLDQLRQLWTRCRDAWGAFVFQANFEVPFEDPLGPLSASLPGGRARILRELNLALLKENIAVLDVDQTASAFGKTRWSDPVLWQVAKQYPAAEALPAFGFEIACGLRALYGLTAKCAVLDLDNTLWGGVIGEDGLQGIKLGGSAAGEAFVSFQRYLKAASQSGLLLAVCSKNNDADARQPFLEHPEMALKLEDIACFRANWQPKDENIREIARAINIGTDSLVFLDDNPAERARIRQLLPEVEVVEMPVEPAQYASAVARRRLFDKLTLTSEDRERTASIRQNAEREELAAAAAGNVDEYLAGLDMRVQLTPFDEPNLPRIVQLINKTNQFNVTTRRRTEAEVRQLLQTPGCYTQAMRVSDRLGDSGLTGVLIALPEGDTLRLDTWLMSCRVLGRKLDEAMFSALVAHARAKGYSRILCDYIPTPKNVVVKDLFSQLGCEPAGEGQFVWRPKEMEKAMPAVLQCVDTTQDG
jgi:FkbH-like protein